VQPFGEIHGCGVNQRGAEPFCATRHARIDGPRGASSAPWPAFASSIGFALAERLHDVIELARRALEVFGRQPFGEILPRFVPPFRCDGGGARQRVRMFGMRTTELADEREHDVELADVAEAPRDFSEAAAQLSGDAGVELQNRDDLAQPPRRDARPVQRTFITLFDAGKHAREPVEAGFE
jgi:hypothetical protein